jgi:tRNA nucleotidyltransferase (CCA-adding enzyme)
LKNNTLGETWLSKDEVLGKKPLVILEKIKENLERLNEKIEVMIEIQRNGNGKKETPLVTDASLDVMTLLNMPDHLRKTAMTICRNGRATAEENCRPNKPSPSSRKSAIP